MNRLRGVLKEYLPFAWATLVAVALWEASVYIFSLPSYLLPAPSGVAIVLFRDAPILFHHAGVTLGEILLGFSLGSGIGCVIAIAMTQSRFVEQIIYPALIVSQTFPKEAMAPLLLVWLGYGIYPKVVVSALICFFPVTINVARGLTAVDPLAMDLMRTYSSSRYQVFFKLRLPSSLPYLFAALKVAVTLSAIGAIVGEFVGASAGLGHLMQVANSQLSTDLIFACLVVLGAMTMCLFMAVEAMERIFLRKHRSAIYETLRGKGVRGLEKK